MRCVQSETELYRIRRARRVEFHEREESFLLDESIEVVVREDVHRGIAGLIDSTGMHGANERQESNHAHSVDESIEVVLREDSPGEERDLRGRREAKKGDASRKTASIIEKNAVAASWPARTLRGCWAAR